MVEAHLQRRLKGGRNSDCSSGLGSSCDKSARDLVSSSMKSGTPSDFATSCANIAGRISPEATSCIIASVYLRLSLISDSRQILDNASQCSLNSGRAVTTTNIFCSLTLDRSFPTSSAVEGSIQCASSTKNSRGRSACSAVTTFDRAMNTDRRSRSGSCHGSGRVGAEGPGKCRAARRYRSHRCQGR